MLGYLPKGRLIMAGKAWLYAPHDNEIEVLNVTDHEGITSPVFITEDDNIQQVLAEFEAEHEVQIISWTYCEVAGSV